MSTDKQRNDTNLTIPHTDVDRDKRRLYGRRQGRTLKLERASVLDSVLPPLQIQPETLKPASLHDVDLFGRTFTGGMWFEIGFGNGEHVAALHRQHADTAFIGAEPFINGMSALMKDIQDDDNSNVRVWMDDAILVVNALADQTLDGIYVLNPDPWPKKRHYKRRIINPDNLDRFARVLKPGGMLIMATDVDDLAGWMRDQAEAHPAFVWTGHPADLHTIPEGWIPTRYEEKGRAAGRIQTYLLYKKL